MRYWQQKQLELVRVVDRGDEYLEVQVAIGPRDRYGCGTLAVPMDVHKSIYEGFKTNDDLWDYLAQSAETMIELFGDARYPRQLQSPEEVEQAAMAAATV